MSGIVVAVVVLKLITERHPHRKNGKARYPSLEATAPSALVVS